MAADIIPFHKKYLKCEQCNKSLTPGNLNTHVNNDYFVEMDDVPGKKKIQVLPIGGIFQILVSGTC